MSYHVNREKLNDDAKNNGAYCRRYRGQ